MVASYNWLPTYRLYLRDGTLALHRPTVVDPKTGQVVKVDGRP